MAVEVPLIATPNQELAIELNEQDCTIQVRQLGDYLYLTLWVDSTLIVENAICMPIEPIVQGSVSGFTGNHGGTACRHFVCKGKKDVEKGERV